MMSTRESYRFRLEFGADGKMFKVLSWKHDGSDKQESLVADLKDFVRGQRAGTWRDVAFWQPSDVSAFVDRTSDNASKWIGRHPARKVSRCDDIVLDGEGFIEGTCVRDEA